MGLNLNYGCGENYLDDCINIDVEKLKGKQDLVCDIKKGDLPFKDNCFDVIYALHVLEHIERYFWPAVFQEFRRVLVANGKLILAYPEFEKCAKNFVENAHGDRDFWRMTLFGRQDYPGDYHVVPMRTAEVVNNLQMYGFNNIKYGPEADEDWSTFVVCHKSDYLPPDRAGIYKKEMFS